MMATAAKATTSEYQIKQKKSIKVLLSIGGWKYWTLTRKMTTDDDQTKETENNPNNFNGKVILKIEKRINFEKAATVKIA